MRRSREVVLSGMWGEGGKEDVRVKRLERVV